MSWKHGNADPFRTYHGLAPDYRPPGDPESPPLSPASVRRYKAFIYGCALFIEERDAEWRKVQAKRGVM
jgi:hypothetical protein